MNIYSEPEKFGLEVVGEVDPGEAYEFDTLVVWRETATGALLYGTDSGCSCPTPFEDMGRDDLTPITAQTWAEFEAAVMDNRDSLDARRALIDKARQVLA